ncbi:MAG: hypothetical protein JWN62_1820 [Acidimicrobiales bacterium]|nr:hypothetical protein [Acidimicrobiales bacterium]
MNPGLFGLSCPQCGAAMEHGPTGTSTCTACQLTYMTRFGYVIPIEPQPPDTNEFAVVAATQPRLSGSATGAEL